MELALDGAMDLSLVGAMGLTLVGAKGLTRVGAIALSRVGATQLTRVGARALTNVGADLSRRTAGRPGVSRSEAIRGMPGSVSAPSRVVRIVASGGPDRG